MSCDLLITQILNGIELPHLGFECISYEDKGNRENCNLGIYSMFVVNSSSGCSSDPRCKQLSKTISLIAMAGHSLGSWSRRQNRDTLTKKNEPTCKTAPGAVERFWPQLYRCREYRVSWPLKSFSLHCSLQSSTRSDGFGGSGADLLTFLCPSTRSLGAICSSKPTQ